MKTFHQWLQETILYHGTQSDFQTLEPRKARYGKGISFTTNPDIARNYALGRYKGGKTNGTPTVKKAEYIGRSFNFYEPVPTDAVRKVHQLLEPYMIEFTPEKSADFLKSLYGSWQKSGERFYKEIQRSFAKQGTDRECKLAKSRNNNQQICKPCNAFAQMPDLLNKILLDVGYDSLCYNDTNDGVSHACYFLIDKNKIREISTK